MGLFGGGNSSSTSNTTNNAYDQRSVTDASGGILGSGNTVDSSTRIASTSAVDNSLHTSDSGNTSSVFTDNSNRASISNLITRDSGNTSNAWADNSNRSLNTVDSGNTLTSWADNSNRSLNTSNSGNTSTWTSATNASRTVNNSTNNVTALDGGAIGASFDAIKGLGSTFTKFGTDALGTVGDALNFAKAAQQSSYSATSDAFGSALSKVTDTFTKALSFSQQQTTTAFAGASGQSSQLAGIYADAKGRGAMTDYLILAAIAGIALVAWRGR